MVAEEDRFEDEIIRGDELVRGFMATRGRTRAAGVPELALEALVSVTDLGRARATELQFEQQAIVARMRGTSSVAEIAAHLQIPLRAAVVVVSEMTAEGLLSAEAVVDAVDMPMLRKIRSAISAL